MVQRMFPNWQVWKYTHRVWIATWETIVRGDRHVWPKSPFHSLGLTWLLISSTFIFMHPSVLKAQPNFVPVKSSIHFLTTSLNWTSCKKQELPHEVSVLLEIVSDMHQIFYYLIVHFCCICVISFYYLNLKITHAFPLEILNK